MSLTCIPYLYGWINTPKGMVYMGYAYNVFDHAVHSAWARQAQMGRVLFVDPFTTEPHSPHFFHLYFLLLGALTRFFHLPLMAAEQAGRLIFGWAFLVLVYAFSAQFTQSVFSRRLALLLTGLSSGLGWLVNARAQPGPFQLTNWAMDYVPSARGLIMPEAITFPSLMIFGLFAVSYFLLTVTFYLLWLAWRHDSWKLALWAGLTAMILGNVHSYDLITVWAVGGVALVALAVARRQLSVKHAAMLAVVLGMSAAPIAYQYHVFLTSQVFRDKANTATWSPPPFDESAGRAPLDYVAGVLRYALTLGLCAFIALPAVVQAVRRRNAGWLYLAAWGLVPFALVYLPFRFQRKVAEGMHVPLCILAALAIGDMLLAVGSRPRMRNGQRRPLPVASQWLVALVVVAAVIPSNVALMGLILKDLGADGHPYYLRAGEVKAMQWLAAHSKPEDAVLSTMLIGAYLPRVAGNHAFLAHLAETLNFGRKQITVSRFFGHSQAVSRLKVLKPMTDDERMNLARANRLAYVYYGPDEKAIAKVEPRHMRCLELVYDNGQVQIYRFKTRLR